MKILAIETSCDETAVALLEISGALETPEVKVLGNTLLSQAQLHEEFGGVYPNLAKREHIKNLPPLLAETLKQAGETPEQPNVDLIAVTTGPGLEPALWTGITFAEKLGKDWGKPVVAVNHMEGHIWSVLYNQETNSTLTLPALALLVSGGHTELVMVNDFGHYEIIGRTLDDAVGEAFDKVARMLGLTYPGGPKISKLAEEARAKGTTPNFTLPRPMIHSHDLNFSYSGLKTAVLYKLKAQESLTEEFKSEVALEFENAAVEVLVKKAEQALEAHSEVKTFIVAGGVSANRYLKRSFENLLEKFPEVSLRFPSPELSTDNAIMIGLAAYVRTQAFPEVLNRAENLIAKGNLSLDSSKV